MPPLAKCGLQTEQSNESEKVVSKSDAKPSRATGAQIHQITSNYDKLNVLEASGGRLESVLGRLGGVSGCLGDVWGRLRGVLRRLGGVFDVSLGVFGAS